MYRCQICQESVPPQTPASRVAVETRARAYSHRLKAHPARGKSKGDWKDDPGGEGTEIVREITVCPECAARRRGPAPE